MNVHRIVSAASLGLLGLMSGLFFISAHDPHNEDLDAVPAHGTYEHVLDAHDHDALHEHGGHALADMYVYAALQLGDFEEMPGTFGEMSDWHGWELHWLDVEHHGEVVRIYHAAGHDHQICFVTMWDSHEGHALGWEPVH